MKSKFIKFTQTEKGAQWCALLIVIVLPLILLIPYLNFFPYPAEAKYSDFTITHFPNFVYIQNSLWKFHQIPLWSDAIFSGYPFAANPLSSLFYPPAWISWILPLPMGLNLLTMLHLVFSAVGIFFFLRSENNSIMASLGGALSLELMTKLFGHLGSGHITLIWAFCWLPWILLSINKANHLPLINKIPITGILWGFVVLADIRWAFYTGILWVFFSLYKFVLKTEDGFFMQKRKEAGHNKRIVNWFCWAFIQGGIGLLLAAPLLLPLYQFSQLSTRSMLTFQDNLIYSLPILSLFGLFIPDMKGFSEWIIYPGAIGMTFLLLTLSNKISRKKNGFWLILLLACFVYSLGNFIPFMSNIVKLPGFNLLRVPSRSLLIGGVCFSYLISYGIDFLYKGNNKDNKNIRWLPPVLVGISMFEFVFAVGMEIISKKINLEFAWGALFIILATILIILMIKELINRNLWTGLVLVLIIIDLGGVAISELRFDSKNAIISQETPIINILNSDRGTFRIYSPSNSIQQEVGALNNLEFANGIDPMQLKTYVSFMEKASGVGIAGYTVTLPPFINGDPDVDNQHAIPDARQLGLLNVKYIVSSFHLQGGEFNYKYKYKNTFIYENPKFLPRSWIQDPTINIGEGIKSIPELSQTPNIINIKTHNSGLLVLSEIDYPGWMAFLDGKEVAIQPVAGILRGVIIPDGDHIVRMVFRPVLVFIGLGTCLMTIFGIIVIHRAKRGSL